MVRLKEGWTPKLEVCEHRSDQTLLCNDTLPCAGFSLVAEEIAQMYSMDLWDMDGSGEVDMLASYMQSDNPVRWTRAFCYPNDVCNGRGQCLSGPECECIRGHELHDCSGCEQGYYTRWENAGTLHSCERCPLSDGKMCKGRGSCLDDAAAKKVAESSTLSILRRGNGSCACAEEHFYGTDGSGRSTCTAGWCPDGSEEHEGRCRPCLPGFASSSGTPCAKCPVGRFSGGASSHCSECPDIRLHLTIIVVLEMSCLQQINYSGAGTSSNLPSSDELRQETSHRSLALQRVRLAQPAQLQVTANIAPAARLGKSHKKGARSARSVRQGNKSSAQILVIAFIPVFIPSPSHFTLEFATYIPANQSHPL